MAVLVINIFVYVVVFVLIVSLFPVFLPMVVQLHVLVDFYVCAVLIFAINGMNDGLMEGVVFDNIIGKGSVLQIIPITLKELLSYLGINQMDIRFDAHYVLQHASIEEMVVSVVDARMTLGNVGVSLMVRMLVEVLLVVFVKPMDLRLLKVEGVLYVAV